MFADASPTDANVADRRLRRRSQAGKQRQKQRRDGRSAWVLSFQIDGRRGGGEWQVRQWKLFLFSLEKQRLTNIGLVFLQWKTMGELSDFIGKFQVYASGNQNSKNTIATAKISTIYLNTFKEKFGIGLIVRISLFCDLRLHISSILSHSNNFSFWKIET